MFFFSDEDDASAQLIHVVSGQVLEFWRADVHATASAAAASIGMTGLPRAFARFLRKLK